MRFSVNTTTPVDGKKCGAFHQAAVRGGTVAFQTRIEALRIGSPVSDATSVDASRSSGHVTTAASSVYRSAAPAACAALL